MRLLTILAASAAIAFAPPLASQTPSPDFKPLEFLVGHCWIGTFPDGKNTDEHCFEWVFDHKFIRDRHVVRATAGSTAAPYQGESLYGWDAKEQQLAYWYWNTNGQMITGSVAYEGKDIIFPGRYDTPKGQVEIKAVWTPLADSYRVSHSQRDGSGWKALWTMTLKRQP